MYRIKDLELIDENINKIKDSASKEYKTLYEPTLVEISNVYNEIKKYIRKTKKIVYGGFAQNLLLTSKNPDESFYKIIDGVYYNWPDVADIEFFSSCPLDDIIKLTEELHAKGFKHVEGKEGIHPETYKIFVNFINYCDISYMPANVYGNLPIIEVDGIKCAHPHFMMVDTYRILTDPMTSYWRLDKTINRFQKLLKYFPIDQKYAKEPIIFKNIESAKSSDLILKIIRKKIIQKSKLVVVGYYACDYYLKKVDKKLSLGILPYYEAISNNLATDGKKIYKYLINRFGNKITTKEFYPFISFTDKRIEYYHMGQLVFRLYGNNERCIVYNYSRKKHTHFGTFNLIFMYLLFNYFIGIITHDKISVKIYSSLLTKLFNGRNTYLDQRNKTVLDSSPFQDFTLKCYGVPTDPMRHALLAGLQKIQQGKRVKFRYNPTGSPCNPPDFHFTNCSGNQIVNEKYLIIK